MSKLPLIAASTLLCAFTVGGTAFADTKSDQPVADSYITTKVKAELVKDSATHASDIKVTTKDGVVTLSGTAESTAEKKMAEQHAASVKGVVGVTNTIAVKE